MKENKRQEAGITLVSLVITVIVILILSGIVVMNVTGKEGIIQKAKESQNSLGNTAMDQEAKANQLIEEWTNTRI